MMAMNYPVFFKEHLRAIWRDPQQYTHAAPAHHCPCCGYEGRFTSAKRNGAEHFRCPNCASRPRDRAISLLFKAWGESLNGTDVLHFAPEWPLFRQLRGEPGYVGGDIIRRRNANAIVDITAIDFPSDAFDYVICNHVLEHVPDDSLAMRECARVLRPDGLAVFTVPITDDQPTWYPPTDMSIADVEAICGWDHKRLYGNDFSDLLRAIGFSVVEFRFGVDDRARFRLLDEPVFFASLSPERLNGPHPDSVNLGSLSDQPDAPEIPRS